MTLSVVVPFFNEEDCLKDFHQRLLKSLSTIDRDYEVIYVDDGSTDSSFSIVSDFHEREKDKIKLLRFSRNFGHHQAVLCGLEHSKGDYIVLINSDLQEPPEAIAELLKECTDSVDCVFSVRKDRKDSFFKNITASLFHFILNKITGMSITNDQMLLRVMTRRFAQALLSMPDQHPYLVGMFQWVGFKQKSMMVEHHPRQAGETKYSFAKILALGWSAFVSFSILPLRLSSFVGILLFLLSMSYGTYVIMNWFLFRTAIIGWSSLMAAICFIGGIQLLVLGIFGEYLGRLYDQARGRPQWILEDKLGIDP